MTEQERIQDPSNTLRDILGFDPVSGARLGEEDRYVPKRDQLLIPQEVQVAFRDFIYGQKDHYISPLRIYPKNLFSIFFSDENDPARPEIIRDYYAYKLTEGSQIDFALTASASFPSDVNSPRVNRVSHHGEYWAVLDGVGITFDSIHNPAGLSVRLASDGKTQFNVDFDKRGVLKVMGYEEMGEFMLQERFSVKGRILKELIEEGHLQLRDGGKLFEFSAEESFVRFQRYDGEILQVNMLIPLLVDRDEVIGNLFDSVTLHDPENAPPPLDDSWRFANLMEVVGIKWERF